MHLRILARVFESIHADCTERRPAFIASENTKNEIEVWISFNEIMGPNDTKFSHQRLG